MLVLLKDKYPKLWKQLKEIAEKHDMKLSEFYSSASKNGDDTSYGDTSYLVGIGEYGYNETGYIFARVSKHENLNETDYDVRETVCFEKNGKLNEEQLEKISNLLEGKQNG